MAALRAGVKTVIIPKENEADLEEIDQNVRKKLEFVTVDHADQVLGLVFPKREAAPAETDGVHHAPAARNRTVKL